MQRKTNINKFLTHFNTYREPSGEQADWTRHCRSMGMFTTPSRGLDRWSVIAPSNTSRDIRNFVESLIRAANGMSMKIERPRE